MVKKLEETEVTYCDICGKKCGEFEGHCWQCGRDLCPQHYHLIHLEGSVEKRFTYLCTPHRDDMEKELNNLFDKYSVARPKSNMKVGASNIEYESKVEHASSKESGTKP